MSVKLYEGAWGITRGGEIVGPMEWSSPLFGMNFVKHDGHVWNADTGDAVKYDRAIVAVFDSKAAAKSHAVALAAATRKPWHRRIPFWPSGWGWWVVAACVLAVLFLSCAPSMTQPCPSGTDTVMGVGGVNADSGKVVCDE